MVRMPLHVTFSETDDGWIAVEIHCAESTHRAQFSGQADALYHATGDIERWFRRQFAVTSDVQATERMLREA